MAGEFLISRPMLESAVTMWCGQCDVLSAAVVTLDGLDTSGFGDGAVSGVERLVGEWEAVGKAISGRADEMGTKIEAVKTSFENLDEECAGRFERPFEGMEEKCSTSGMTTPINPRTPESDEFASWLGGGK